MVGQEYLDTTMAYLVTKGLEDNFTKECSIKNKNKPQFVPISSGQYVLLIIKKIGTNWRCNLNPQCAVL